MSILEEIPEKYQRKVLVFRDHPEWDKREKWWMLPIPLLDELFICEYIADERCFDKHIASIEKDNLGCVYVY